MNIIEKILSILLKSNIEQTPVEKTEEEIDLSRIKYSFRLKGVHRDLLIILSEVSKTMLIAVPQYGGLRTLEQQKKLVANGVSKTLKSKHLSGNAVDIVPYYNEKIDWSALNDFSYLAGFVKSVAIQKGIPIRQGILWDKKTIKSNRFKDFGHLELVQNTNP